MFTRYLFEEKPLLTACEAVPTRMKNMRFSVLALPCILLSTLVPVLMLSGCMGGKKTVDPYTGRTPSKSSSSSQQTVQSVPPTGSTPADQAAYARDLLMPALARINGRITAYEQKEQFWQNLTGKTDFSTLSSSQISQLSSCRLQATDLLTDYKQLHDQLLSDQSMDSSRWMVSRSLPALENKDIAYLEGDCTRLCYGFGFSSAAGDTAAGMQALEGSMATSLAAGNYSRVISDYQALSLAPGEQPGFSASYTYGIALMKSGREKEAGSVLNNLLERVREQGLGQLEFNLLQLLGDLDFGLKKYPAARSRYEEFERVSGELGERNDRVRHQLAVLNSADMNSEEVDSYASLLLNYLAYDSQRDGFTVVQQARAFQQRYPVSVVGSSVVDLARKANEDAEKWFAGLLERVDRLSAEHKNQEALLLIERIPSGILPLDKQAVLKLKVNAMTTPLSFDQAGTDSIQEEILQTTVQTGPAIETKNGQAVDSVDSGNVNNSNIPVGYVPVNALQETWDQGIAKMKSKDYDKAIEIFDGLLNTSYGVKAGLQIEEASRLAAQDDRRKAAELFIRANRTTDPGTRKELLLSSKVLLEDIIRKYPKSGLEEKVRRNLSRIEQELSTTEQAIAPEQGDGEVRAQGIKVESMNIRGERTF